MPKVVTTSAKGLVQSTGAGVQINNGLSLGGIQTITVPAAAAAAAASRISADTTTVILSSAGAGNRVYLPDPGSVPAGKIYFLILGGSTNCELCSEGVSVAFNDTTGVTSGSGAAAKELVLVAQTVTVCIRESATKWRIVTLADGGAADAV